MLVWANTFFFAIYYCVSGPLICDRRCVCNRIAFGLRLYWTTPTVLARETCVIKVNRLYTRKRSFPSKASLCNRTKFRIERADTHLTVFWISNYSVCQEQYDTITQFIWITNQCNLNNNARTNKRPNHIGIITIVG